MTPGERARRQWITADAERISRVVRDLFEPALAPKAPVLARTIARDALASPDCELKRGFEWSRVGKDGS